MFAKRNIALLISLIMILSACSSVSDNPTAGDSEASSKSKEEKVVHLNFWGAIPPETGPQELVDNWNKANPNIQVTYTRFVNDDSGNTKLETALVAGTVDVFINYSWQIMQKRIDNKLLEPLDPFLDKDKFN